MSLVEVKRSKNYKVMPFVPARSGGRGRGKARQRPWKRRPPPKRKQQPRNGQGMLIPRGTPSMTTIPSSYFDDSYREIGKFAQSAAPAAGDYKTGSRIIGCDFLCNVGTTSGNTRLFSGYPAGYNNTYNTLSLSPINFPRLATIALNFSRFIFRELCVEYTPFVGTTTAGAFALGYDADGAPSTIPINSGLSVAMGFLNNLVTPWWKPACMAIKLYNKNLSYTMWNSGSAPADYRNAAQGSLIGIPNTSGSTTTVNGQVCVKYVCDFYGPTPPVSTLAYLDHKTTSMSSEEIKHAMQKLAEEYAHRESTEYVQVSTPLPTHQTIGVPTPRTRDERKFPTQ